MSTLIYTLATPVSVGDFHNPVLVDKLQLYSLSLTAGDAKPTLSIVLIHVASGYQINVVYTDATVMAFWNSINAGNALTQAAFQKLVTDGKLPTGTLA